MKFSEIGRYLKHLAAKLILAWDRGELGVVVLGQEVLVNEGFDLLEVDEFAASAGFNDGLSCFLPSANCFINKR